MNPNIAAHEVWLRTRFGEPATGKVTEQDLDRLQAYRATPEQIEAAKAVETLPLTGKNLMYAALIVAAVMCICFGLDLYRSLA